MLRTRMVMLATLAAFTLAKPLAAAPDTAAEKTERGRKMGLAAVELARSGSYAEAADLFRQVYDLTHDPMALYNLGQVAARMGDLPKAREALERFVGNEKDPGALARGRKALKDVMARWPGSIRVTTPVQGARVEVDGKLVGETPLAEAIEVAPGQHQVKVVASGKRVFERRVEVASSESMVLSVTLEGEPSPVAPTPAPPPPVAASAKPADLPVPTAAPNDLSGRVDVLAEAKESKGLSTLTWVLISSGAAVLVGGGLAAFFLLRGQGSDAPADVKWTWR